MGWNQGYTILEKTVVDLYNANLLTKEVLNIIVNPYRNTDCDSGGSNNLRANDGKNFEQIVCSILYPKEYEDAIKHPQYDKEDKKYIELLKDSSDDWYYNEKAMDLFDKIWREDWKIW